jgi:MinD superfamily P-loop ATPase
MRQRSSVRAYDVSVPNLRIVPPVAASESERRRQRLKESKPAALIECRCGCREVIETKSSVLLKDGRPQGGVKQLICAACFAKGERVVLA